MNHRIKRISRILSVDKKTITLLYSASMENSFAFKHHDLWWKVQQLRLLEEIDDGLFNDFLEISMGLYDSMKDRYVKPLSS